MPYAMRANCMEIVEAPDLASPNHIGMQKSPDQRHRIDADMGIKIFVFVQNNGFAVLGGNIFQRGKQTIF